MTFNVNSTFGSSLIIWDFWTWKTFGVENIVYQAKDKNPDDICLISNIPNYITDIPYNSPDDLRQIIEYLFRFFVESNININQYNKNFRDIILVIDEAHLYFPQDWTCLSSDKDLLIKFIEINTIFLLSCIKFLKPMIFFYPTTTKNDLKHFNNLQFKRLVFLIY